MKNTPTHTHTHTHCCCSSIKPEETPTHTHTHTDLLLLFKTRGDTDHTPTLTEMLTTRLKIFMVGLDEAGKTTILSKLTLAKVVTTTPTIGFNVQIVEHKNISFTLWDIGGRSVIRHMWKHYWENTKGLIFVVDSTDPERIKEAADELHKMLEDDELRAATLLVFANKQDLPQAMSVSDITEALSLSGVSQPWFVQASSAVSGTGLAEGLDWLSNQIQPVEADLEDLL